MMLGIKQKRGGRPPELTYQFGVDPRNVFVWLSALAAIYFGWDLWTIQKYFRTNEVVVSEYVFLASVAFLVLSVLNRFHENIPKIVGSSLILDTMISVLLLLAIWFLGLRHFGGYDHSALIESGWIQLSSLVPFRDYPCTLPPLHLIGDKCALLLFGVRWSAFVALMACFAVLSFLFVSSQLRALGFTPVWAAGLAMVAQLGTSVIFSYWWYNPVSSLVGIMAFLSALVCLVNPNKSRWILLCLSVTLLVLGKPNTWPVGACFVILISAPDPTPRLRAAVVVSAGVALAVGISWAYGFGPVDIYRTYTQLAINRGNPLSMQAFSDFMPIERKILLSSIIALTALFLVLLMTGKNEYRDYWREYCCCIASALTSLGMAFTNYELKTSDLMPMVITMTVMAFQPWSKRRFHPLRRAAVVIMITFIAVFSGYWSVTRLRVRDIGNEMFFQNVPTERIRDGFFAGLHSGPRLIAVLDQIKEVLSLYPSAKVFFGPRLEFSYAAFRRTPPAGLPIWWHPGTSFSADDFRSILFSFERDNFDVLIFLKGDYTRMPSHILAYKDEFYDEVPGYSQLGVYIKKARVSSIRTRSR